MRSTVEKIPLQSDLVTSIAHGIGVDSTDELDFKADDVKLSLELWRITSVTHDPLISEWDQLKAGKFPTANSVCAFQRVGHSSYHRLL